MNILLSEKQEDLKKKCSEFVDKEVKPRIKEFEKNNFINKDFFKIMGDYGYLAGSVNQEYGGQAFNMIELGIIQEELGMGYMSVQNISTVSEMVSSVIYKFGTEEQKRRYLPGMTSGELIGAFALTEPLVGSSIKEIKTEASYSEGSFIINGKKKWITLAQIADFFIVFAKYNEKPCAFLVDSNTAGIKINPISNILGFRCNMLAEVEFNNCKISEEDLLGSVGFGLNLVASLGLTRGRYTTAWGGIGLAQAALDDAVVYSKNRMQFDRKIGDFQINKRSLSIMISELHAARLLCYNSGILYDNHKKKEFLNEVLVAKYFSSKIANDCAYRALQLHGANGVLPEYNVERYFRDAKILECIEGVSELYEVLIVDNEVR